MPSIWLWLLSTSIHFTMGLFSTHKHPLFILVQFTYWQRRNLGWKVTFGLLLPLEKRLVFSLQCAFVFKGRSFHPFIVIDKVKSLLFCFDWPEKILRQSFCNSDLFSGRASTPMLRIPSSLAEFQNLLAEIDLGLHAQNLNNKINIKNYVKMSGWDKFD